MSKKFSVQIDDIIKTVDKRLLAVARESTQRTIDIAQLPEAKGGRMKVDTGFLRASGQAALNGVPAGPIRGAPDGVYPYDPGQVTAVIARFQIGMSFFFAWTANYAKYREAYDGFLAVAIQRWPQTVAAVVNEVRARIK